MFGSLPFRESTPLEAVLPLLSQSANASAETLHIQRLSLLMHCFASETYASVAPMQRINGDLLPTKCGLHGRM